MQNFENPCFDPKAVQDLSELTNDNGESLIIDLYDLYSKSSPGILLAIEGAFQKNDAHSIQKQAHSLKSSSASLGLLQMQERCAYLEKNANVIVASQEVAMIQDLKRCFQKSLKLLQDFVRQKKAA